MPTDESGTWESTGSLVIDGISYIPSSVLLSGTPKLTLKDNRAFGVFDPRGNAPRSVHPGAELGLFFEDTRHIAVWELTVNGSTPVALASELRHDGRVLVISMTNRDLPGIDGAPRIPRDTLLIRRILALHGDRFHEVIAIRNFDRAAHCLQLEHWAGSRFDDIFEVRGFRREQRGRNLPTQSHIEGETEATRRHESILRHEGLDGLISESHIIRHFPAASIRQAPGISSVFTRVDAPAHGDIEFRTTVEFGRFSHEKSLMPREASRDSWLKESLAAWLTGISNTPKTGLEPGEGKLWQQLKIQSSHLPFDQGLQRSASDLRMLLSNEGKGCLYPYAGIPWFSAPFGRDGIITALQLLPWCPEVSAQVLRFVFTHLGSRDDPYTEEEPGRVFHELRRGEMARRREVPFVPYYGSVDATPLALVLLGEYHRWTGDLGLVRELWSESKRALEWMKQNSSKHEAGFLSYARRSPTGLVNQGWKDSHDSVMHADGTVAEAPISLCEVQAYAWRAWQEMARLGELLESPEVIEEGRRLSERIKTEFDRRFWLAEEGYIALAVDALGKPCRVRSSNMGHCLWSGILDSAQASSVSRHLMDPALFSGLGIRTLADTERSYNPMSYHNGSIWPHDNSLILEGLRRHGEVEAVQKLGTALTDALLLSPEHRMPELYCGFRRRGTEAPIPYEVACRPQAWAAGSVFMLLKGMLGLSREDPSEPVVLRDPVLPSPLLHLGVEGLSFPQGELSFELRKVTSEGNHSRSYRIESLSTTGTLRALVVRSKEAPLI